MPQHDVLGLGDLSKLPLKIRLAIFEAYFSPRRITYHANRTNLTAPWEEQYDDSLLLVSRIVSLEARTAKGTAPVHLTITSYKNVPVKTVRDVVTHIYIDTDGLEPMPGDSRWRRFPAHEYPSLREMRFIGEQIEVVTTDELGGTLQDLVSGRLDSAAVRYVQCVLNITDARQLLEHQDALLNRPRMLFDACVLHSLSRVKIFMVVEANDAEWIVVTREVHEADRRRLDKWLQDQGLLSENHDFSRAGAFTAGCTHRVEVRSWCKWCNAIKLRNRHG